MKLPSLVGAALPAVVLAAVASWSSAQIERLDLPAMVSKTDGAVIGNIVDSEVIRVDHPTDGPELFFTTIVIQGKSLHDGSNVTVPVTFPGGFVSPDEGVWNSEAPSADEIAHGNRVVAFYKWTDNMGGDVSANALYASHGGLFRVVSGRGSPVVLGKGDGYAISRNVRVDRLTQQIAELR